MVKLSDGVPEPYPTDGWATDALTRPGHAGWLIAPGRRGTATSYVLWSGRLVAFAVLLVRTPGRTPALSGERA